MKSPMVSILCTTYNHISYIRDALEGFLRQDVPFDYEVIVHDDASTDGTDNIIREYAEKYPEIICSILENTNQMSKGVDIWAAMFARCRGKYYAVCEGDDFWIDSNKLRIQVEYMEKHPDCMMTVHNALIFNCETQAFSLYGSLTEEHDLSPAEIIVEKKSGFATASMVFRPEALYPADSFYTAGKIGDWPLRLHVLAQGHKIHYFSRVMSVYRQWSLGSWGSRTYRDFVPALKHIWELIDLMQQYNRATERKYEQYIVARIQRDIWHLFDIAKTKDIREFEKLVNNCDEAFLLGHENYIKELKKVFSQIYDESVILDSSLLRKLQSSRHAVIYGAGNFGKKMARQIESGGGVFDGFVVSDGQEHLKTVWEKPIWTLGALPFAPSDVLVVVAILPTIWDELYANLKRANFVHIICPLLYDIE